MLSGLLRKLAAGAEALERFGAALGRVEYALHEIAAAQRLMAVNAAYCNAFLTTSYPGSKEQRDASRAYLGLPLEGP